MQYKSIIYNYKKQLFIHTTLTILNFDITVIAIQFEKTKKPQPNFCWMRLLWNKQSDEK